MATHKPRKKPRQERARVTVQALLEATTQILIEEGYYKTTTNKIAKRAGISIGSLYQYFPNKESIIAELIQTHATQQTQLLRSKLREFSETPPEVAVAALIDVLLEAHRLNPKLHRVVLEQIPNLGLKDLLTSCRQQAILMLTHELQRRQEKQLYTAIRPQNLEMASFIVVYTIEGLIQNALTQSDFFDDEQKTATYKTEICQLILRYLAVDPSTPPPS